jgi:drug/metabolite transporter (DMT)-like permease
VGYALAVCSSVAGALAVVVGKWNLQSITPLLMNCLIFSIPAVIFTIVLLSTKGWRHLYVHSGQAWRWIGLFSASSIGALWFFWAGVQKMDPSLAAFLNSFEVLITIFLAVILLSERLNRWETMGALVSVTGLVIMRMSLRIEYGSGFWLVLLGAICFGITEFVSKIAVRYVAPSVLTCLRSTFMATAFWLAFLVTGEDFGGLKTAWLGVIGLGILGPIIARMFYLWTMQRLEVTKAAIVAQMSPAFVLILAFGVLDQHPTLRELVGGILIVSGCVFMIWMRQTPTASAPLPG